MKILLIAALFCATSPAATTIRIACGSSTGGVDAAGNLWQSDAHFSGGTDYSRANMAALDLPYRALRYGSFSYSVPLPNGEYTVKLLWLENRTAASVPPIAAGQRKIAASIAGSELIQVVASGLDLFAVAGSMMPYTQTAAVGVTNGKMVITLVPSSPDSLAALLSGIEIISVDPPDAPPAVPYITGLESAPPACPAGFALFLATDTNHLFWCYSGSTWHVVGDVRNAEPDKLVALDVCTGSGPGWDCAGLYRAMIRRADGSMMPVIGPSFDAALGVGASWIPVR